MPGRGTSDIGSSEILVTCAAVVRCPASRALQIGREPSWTVFEQRKISHQICISDCKPLAAGLFGPKARQALCIRFGAGNWSCTCTAHSGCVAPGCGCLAVCLSALTAKPATKFFNIPLWPIC